MPTPDTEGETLWGPVNTNSKKEDLDKIAKALGIHKKKDNRATALRKIKKHLENNPQLAKQKRFQGLFSYRKDREVESGGSKRSEDKEAEDDLEGSKTAKQATGALKTLADQEVARDPPARTARLNAPVTRSSVPSKETINELSDEEESSPEPTTEVPSKSLTPIASTEPEGVMRGDFEAERAASLGNGSSTFPETPKKAYTQDGASYGRSGRGFDPDVIVAFQHDSGPVDEVHVPGAGRLVRRVRDKQGKEHPVVRLSELLPVAFEYASTPMKNRGGRLSRPGTIGDSQVDIGSIAAFARNERVKYLESEKTNSYELEQAHEDDNTLVCRLFVRGESAQTLPPLPSTFQTPTRQSTSDMNVNPPARPSSVQAKHARPEVGVDKDKSQVEDSFIVWLRTQLNGPKRDWGRGTTVAEILPRVKALRGALDEIKAWGWLKSQGGYQVSEDAEDAGSYAGRSFKKDDILKALRLGSTTSNSNEKLFAPAIMRKISKLEEWYEEPDGPHAAFFEHMSIKNFTKWRDEQLKLARGQKANDKGKKRKYSSDEGESSSDDDVRHRSHRSESKKVKKAKRLSSEDLD